jgi:hypothetical protein
MNSVAVSATTPIPSPSHIFQSPVEAVSPYADFVPTNPVYTALARKSAPSLGSIVKAMRAQQELGKRKTLRTVIVREDGTIIGAKIDLETAEKWPHEYKDYFTRPDKPKANPNASDLEPFWMKMAPWKSSWSTEALIDRSRIKTANNIKAHLQRTIEKAQTTDKVVAPTSLRKEIEFRFPWLIEIIESVNLLDMDGNTRGLSIDRMLSMLTHLDVISSAAIRVFTGCSKTHSERFASCLRVIDSAFVRRIKVQSGTKIHEAPPK